MAAFTKEQVVEVLKTVYDPEIPVNIYDLGLIYDIDIEDNEVNIVMSLTSQACPSAAEIPASIEHRVTSTLNSEKCMVHIVWSPPWTPQRISAEGKKILGIEEDADQEKDEDSADASNTNVDNSTKSSAADDDE